MSTSRKIFGLGPSSTSGARVPLRRRPRSAPVPLSYSQQRLWFVHQLEEGTNEYNLAHAWRLTGPLDPVALVRALNVLVERHESLRTYVGEVAGRPVQVIDPHLTLDLPLRDLSHLAPDAQRCELASELQRGWQEPFDLTRGALFRARLLKVAEDEHVLIRAMHHLITDGWSNAVLTRELGLVYSALVEGYEHGLAPLQLQYADFTLWQRRRFEAGAVDLGLEYWRRRLQGLGEPLASARQRERRHAWESGATHKVALDPDVCARLRALARAEEATPAMALLAAFRVVLARWTGRTDVPVGMVVSNRTRAQLHGLVGLFVNLVVVRGDCSGDLTFRRHLQRTRQACLEACTYQEVPLEKLVEELNPPRSLGWNPLFQVVFNVLNFPRTTLQMSGVRVEPIPIERAVRATFDLKVDVVAADDVVLNVTYNSRLFEAPTIDEMFDAFQRLVVQATDTPDRALEIRSSAAHTEALANSSAPVSAGGGVAAQTSDDGALCELFQEVLGVAHVGPDDDFFDLGGHSLLIMWLRNRIRARFGVDIPLRTVFEAPTVRQLSARIQQIDRVKGSHLVGTRQDS